MSTAKEKKALCDKNYQHKNKDRLNKRRAELYQIQKNRQYLTRPAAAVYLGLTTQKLANIVNFGKYWQVPEHISDKGVVRYHKKDLDNCKLHNPQYFDEWRLIKKGYYVMSKDVMLITAWLQETKDITKECAERRVEIDSDSLWARWG